MIQVLELPHAQARSILSDGAPVYLSINPVEYHGPHLSLHNDALISAGLIPDLHAGLRQTQPDWPLLCAGELEIGVDPVPGPGSRPVPYARASELIRIACDSLAKLGARRVVLMTFHGSPLHNLAIYQGVTLLERLGVQAFAPMNVALPYLLGGDATLIADAYAFVEDGREREGMMREAAFDFHAGFLETSLALHYAPAAVGAHRELPPSPRVSSVPALASLSRFLDARGRRQAAAELRVLAWALGWYALRPFPGYTGRPHRARAEAGACLARWLTAKFVESAAAVFSGGSQTPRPPMPWMTTLTLGGRIGRIEIPHQEIGLPAETEPRAAGA